MPFNLFKKKTKSIFPDPKESLTPSQKILTNPFISKAIDFITLGQSVEQAEHPIKTALEAGERYPRGILKGLENIQSGQPPKFLPEIFAPTPDPRSATAIAQAMGAKILPEPVISDPESKLEYGATLAKEFFKNLPFTTAGVGTEIAANPINILAGAGAQKLSGLPFMKSEIKAPKAIDDAITSIIKLVNPKLATSLKRQRLTKDVKTQIEAVKATQFNDWQTKTGELLKQYSPKGALEAEIQGLLKTKNIKVKGNDISKIREGILNEWSKSVYSANRVKSPIPIRSPKDILLGKSGQAELPFEQNIPSKLPGEIPKIPIPATSATDWLKSVKKVLGSEAGEKKIITGKEIAAAGKKLIPKTVDEALPVLSAGLKPTLTEGPVIKAEPEGALIQEAKKFKTAKEFVKTKKKDIVYHGTDYKFDKFTLSTFGRTDEGFAGIGNYFTSQKEYAKSYGKNIKEAYLDLKNPYIYNDAMPLGSVNPDDFRRSLGLSENASSRKVRDTLLKKGYDGVIINEVNDSGEIITPKIEIMAMGNKQIKSKKQLTDIYNKANPPTKPPTKPPVAKGVPEEPIKPVPAAKVKGIVRKETGQVKPAVPAKITERQALKRELGQEQKASRVGYVAGKKLGAEEAKLKIREVLKGTKERKELSGEVKRLIKNIQTKPTKDLPIEYKDAIEDIKSNIDFEKVRLSNILKREKALKLVDEDVREAAKELALISAEDMTLADLQEVENIVSQIYHSGVHEHRFLSNEIKIDFDKSVIKASEQLKSKKGKTELPLEKILKEESPKSRNKRTAKHYLYADRRPEAIFEELDNFKEGGVFTETVWNPTIEGISKYYDDLDKVVQDITKITDPMKGKTFLKMFKVGGDWINAGGKTISIPGIKTKITRSDAMAVYAHSQNETNTAHLKAMGFNDVQMSNVIGQLSSEEKKVVDDVIDYLTKELFPMVDKTNVALKGTHLNAVDRYFPIVGLQDLGSTNAVKIDLKSREDYRRSSMVTSFAKEREVTDSTTKGFKRLDFFSTLYNHLKNVSYYNNMAIPIRDASKLLLNPTVRASIKNKHDASLNIILGRWLDSIKTNRIPGATTPVMDFIDTIGKNAVTFFVSGNLSTATKQTASFLQGAEYIGKRDAAAGLLQVMMNPLGILEFASNRSTLIRERAKGLNIERDFQEMLAGKGAAGKFGVKDTDAAKKLKDLYGIAKVISMTPLRIMDMSTVLCIWKGAYDSKIDLGSKEAIKFADKAIRRTQPMSGVINLPDNFRAGVMLRQLTRLRNQPSQNMNLLVDTVKKFAGSENKGKAAKKFGSNLIWMYIAPAVMFGLLSRKRWYRNTKEFAHDLVNYGIGGFTGMGGLFNAVAAPYFSSDLYNSWLDKIKDIQQGRGAEAKQKAALSAAGIAIGAPAGGQALKFAFGKDPQQKLLGGESQATRLKFEYKSALQITDKSKRLEKIKEINRKVKKKGLSVARVSKDGKAWLRNEMRSKHKMKGNVDEIENIRIIRKMSKEDRGMFIRTYSASTQENIRDKL